jgi:type IV pilus assembly protein PilE
LAGERLSAGRFRLDVAVGSAYIASHWQRGALRVKNKRGFTLIELMIAVLVLAVLAALAVPAYWGQVRKSRRSSIEASVQQVALLEERYRADNTTYLTASSSNWSTLGGDPSNTYYTVTTTGAASTYAITAAAQSSQTKDQSRGKSCSSLMYVYGVNATADGLCTTATAAGKVSKCPEQCWGG